MSTAYRLDRVGLVDRSVSVKFRFDNRDSYGYRGDTLASALLANNVRLVARSFKYHRPRGILSAGPEEPNALVELRTGARREPNTRATTIELHEGLEATSQNRWPSLEHDLLSVNSLLAPIFAAGFYYKTFMWPSSFWERLYEPLIRRAAGLGRAADAPDPDRYEQCFAFCDLLVVGGGPAGLAAAVIAGRAGLRVLLCDQDFRMGGRLLAERQLLDGVDALDWVEATLAELQGMPEIRLMPRTTVFGTYDHGTFGAVERVSDHRLQPGPFEPRQRMWRIVARQAIVATGAIEQPQTFSGNDRPGVMLAGAVRAYVNRFGVAPGRRAVIYASCDDAWRTLTDLNAAGVNVVAIADTRDSVPEVLRGAANALGVPVFEGARVAGTHGGKQLTAVDIARRDGRRHRVVADLLAVSNGWNPTFHLACHLGGRPTWSETTRSFEPGSLPGGMQVAGAAAARMTLAACLAAGAKAGTQAALACGAQPSGFPSLKIGPEMEGASPLRRASGVAAKAFVDYQHDVTVDDIRLATREGYQTVEHLKRYTTLGMATDQGKTANLAGLAILANATQRDIAETGTTVFRPPYTPVAIGALAGSHRGREFQPTRLTPMHAWAEATGAVFTEVGEWLRALSFPRPGEESGQDTVNREVRSVRSSVGVCDVSTLGKLEIHGRDAARFLDRVYCNRIGNLPIGKARYGLMLREDGFVMDDGTIARLGEEHFVISTTTVNAAKVAQHLEYYRQVVWSSLELQIVVVSERWAQLAIAGPASRRLLERLLDPGQDISNAAFPFLAVREVGVGSGVRARLFRISFSGELGYELAVPADFGEAAIRAVVAAGHDLDITPYGLETLNVLRIEKGHVAGSELNGRTTAHDLGLGRLMAAKSDFVGKQMAGREGLTAPGRPALAGFRPVDSRKELSAGAHFIPRGKPAIASHDEGYLTSAAFSPTLGHWIGLGFIENASARIGETVRAVDLMRGTDTEVVISRPAFVDPEGVRLHA